MLDKDCKWKLHNVIQVLNLICICKIVRYLAWHVLSNLNADNRKIHPPREIHCLK